MAALHALEWAYRHRLFDYRPTREPGRWLLLLLDVTGQRMRLNPHERLALSAHGFLERLSLMDLAYLSKRTREALCSAFARQFDVPAQLAEPVLERMSVAAVLWQLGVTLTSDHDREKHPQGRQVRAALRSRIDGAWDTGLASLEATQSVTAVSFLASLPIAARTTLVEVQAALREVDEDLADVPFAVFYALLTDARRGGRVWRPPAAYVESHSYDRAAFDATVGHALDSVRSRKRRYHHHRSAVLGDLGLSTMFPATIARLDAWLDAKEIPEFRIDAGGATGTPDWYAWVTSHSAEIAELHRHLLGALATDLGRGPPSGQRAA